ncbi:MAG: hypothetical protein D6714_21580 [Bacteroidetes bacterium]|nr:MAG: hypothetical protein D6714_21580 [Bacteroidota bacterium]
MNEMSTTIRFFLTACWAGLSWAQVCFGFAPLFSEADSLRDRLDWFLTHDTIEVSPVCGIDGKTYINADEARYYGVTTWSEGRCPGYQPVICVRPERYQLMRFELNDLVQHSEYNPEGYANFSNVIFEVYKTQNNRLTFKPNTYQSSEDLVLKIWIDFNENNRFDPDELVLRHPVSALESPPPYLNIPAGAPDDLVTRMRVFFGPEGQWPESGYIESGEVEDYTVVIVP